jgi:hypothetical protein
MDINGLATLAAMVAHLGLPDDICQQICNMIRQGALQDALSLLEEQTPSATSVMDPSSFAKLCRITLFRKFLNQLTIFPILC